MPRIIVIYAPLGGVGRTTIAINLACQLTINWTVRLIDADERGVAAAWIGAGRLPVTGEWLPLEHDQHAAAWTRHVSAQSADAVVIDLPPHNGPAVRAAAIIADLVLVPMVDSSYGRHVAASASQWLRMLRSTRQDRKPAILLVPSRVGPSTHAESVAQAAFGESGEIVGPAIRSRAAYMASARSQDWVGHSAPRSAAYRDIVALTTCVVGLAWP